MSTVSFWTVLDHPRRVEVIEKLENILAEVDIEEPGLEADAFALLREVGLAVETTPEDCCEPCRNCGACYPICDAHSAWCSNKRVRTSDRIENDEEAE